MSTQPTREPRKKRERERGGRVTPTNSKQGSHQNKGWESNLGSESPKGDITQSMQNLTLDPVKSTYTASQTPSVKPVETISIPGMEYIPNFITDEEEKTLLDNIDAQQWSTVLKRRTQHYGYNFDYETGDICKTTPLTEFASNIAQKIFDKKYTPFLFDQLIINEYTPGQGIASHIDRIHCFDSYVASLSLGSGCYMKFTSPSDQIVFVYLEPKSLVILSGDARYRWKHGIERGPMDLVAGKKIQRTRRVSLTFRKIIESSLQG